MAEINYKKLMFWVLIFLISVLVILPVNELNLKFYFWDKLQHALAFMCLIVVGHLAYPHPSNHLGINLFMYGIGIELVQLVAPWRSFDLMDIIANSVGLIIGWIFFSFPRFFLVSRRFYQKNL
jgi:glycopeptide antibiotics resistance protein